MSSLTKRNKMIRKISPLLLSALVLGGLFVGCSDEEPQDSKDPCDGQGSGCGAPLLQFAIWDPLPDGEYRITVESPEGDGACTVVRDGLTETDRPNYSFQCDEASFEETANFDIYGLLFYDWMPETITVTLTNVDSGCAVSQTEQPSYEATWSECGETCIDALIELDTAELRTPRCTSGLGGAGGSGGAQ